MREWVVDVSRTRNRQVDRRCRSRGAAKGGRSRGHISPVSPTVFATSTRDSAASAALDGAMKLVASRLSLLPDSTADAPVLTTARARKKVREEVVHGAWVALAEPAAFSRPIEPRRAEYAERDVLYPYDVSAVAWERAREAPGRREQRMVDSTVDSEPSTCRSITDELIPPLSGGMCRGGQVRGVIEAPGGPSLLLFGPPTRAVLHQKRGFPGPRAEPLAHVFS